MLSEKAKSKAQQRFFGMVRAAQKGEMENPSKEVSDVASDISMKDAKKFAKTKHKGLPEKKKEVVTEADKKGKGSGKKDACYHKVKASSKVWPSAYASGRLVQCRKKGAGNYGKSKSESYSWRDDVTEGSLHKWFNSSKSKDGKKGWVQSDGSPCANEPGETKTPKCYSSSKRASMSKKELRSADARKSRQDPNQQQKSGAAKPTYVSTDKPKKKKVNEAAAWTKKSGKNPSGGLNEKGRKSYERENPGSDLKAPQPEGGSRKKSFCARMGGMKKKLTSSKTANDPDSRINKSLRKWKCNEEKIEEVAFLAGLAKGAAVAAKGMAKGAVKQKAKQVVKQKAANVAMGAIPQPNRDQQVQQLESKGTAELAAIKLRGRKACAVCGSLAHTTGQCPKKEHGDVNEGIGRTIGQVAGTVAKAAKAVNREVLPIKHAKNLEKEIKKGYDESKPKEVKKKINKKRNILQKGIGKVARAVSSKTDKIASTMGEARVDKGRSDYGKATIRNWRHSGPDTVEPAMFDPENKRGKTIDKRREEHKERRGKKGAKVSVHGVDEGVVDKLKKFGEYLAPTPGKGTSNEPSVAAGTRTPKSTHMFKHVPSMNKDGTTGQYGKKGSTAVIQGVGNVSKKFAPTAKTVAKAALPVAGAVGAGLAVSKGVDSLMKMGKKKKIKEQILDELNLDELKLFGKKGSGAIFYNDPKGRRDALNTTGKDPGAINKPAVDKAVNTVKTKVQKTVDTQTNRAGANIGNQISRKVQPAVSSGVADGIKQGATAVGKAALKGAGAVGAGLAVSKGVDSLMKGGKKKTNEELSIVDRMLIEYSPNVAYQDKKKGKLGKSSVYSLRGKDESKKDFRKSHVKDIEGGYVGAGHKPTPGNLKKEEVVLEKKKQPSVHDDYYDPMEDPTFDPHEAEATRGQSGRGTKGKMNVRKKYPVKEGVVDVIKKGTKRHKDAVEKKKIKNRKAVPYAALGASYQPEGEVVNEKISASGYARAKKYREDQAREKDRKEQEYFAKKAKTHKWDGEKWNKREVSEENKKGLDGKECWDGYKLAGTKKKGGKTVDNCVPVKEAKVDAGKSPEEKEKVRNVRKFGVSHNVAGHGKLRRSLHKMNRGDKKIPGDKSAWVEMEAYRVLASSDGQEKPSQFSYKDEKTAKKYADSIKKGGGKATVVKEDIGSFKDYMANVEAAKKRQQDKQENRKKKSDAYIERVRQGIKFYDAKGSGRMVKGKKVYDRK